MIRHLTLLLAVPGAALPAQARKSQHAMVLQAIGAAQVTIVYNRPGARGRTLFGALVPWGKLWCPGADEATTITLTKDVLVAGQRLFDVSAGAFGAFLAIAGDDHFRTPSLDYSVFSSVLPAARRMTSRAF